MTDSTTDPRTPLGDAERPAHLCACRDDRICLYHSAPEYFDQRPSHLRRPTPEALALATEWFDDGKSDRLTAARAFQLALRLTPVLDTRDTEIAALRAEVSAKDAKLNHTQRVVEVSTDNLRDALTAMRMIKDAVQELGSVGCVKERDVGPPDYYIDAAEIIGGIQSSLAAKDAEIERLRAANEWQPIETAPKDERLILTSTTDPNSLPILAAWDEEFKCWYTFNNMLETAMHKRDPKWTWQPTHWRPLLSPPTIN